MLMGKVSMSTKLELHSKTAFNLGSQGFWVFGLIHASCMKSCFLGVVYFRLQNKHLSLWPSLAETCWSNNKVVLYSTSGVFDLSSLLPLFMHLGSWWKFCQKPFFYTSKLVQMFKRILLKLVVYYSGSTLVSRPVWISVLSQICPYSTQDFISTLWSH